MTLKMGKSRMNLVEEAEAPRGGLPTLREADMKREATGVGEVLDETEKGLAQATREEKETEEIFVDEEKERILYMSE